MMKQFAWLVRLSARRPSTREWGEAVAQTEARCTIPRDHNHPVRGQRYAWTCPRCNDLYALALIHATMSGDVPSLAVLDRLLDALETTGRKAA